MLAVMLFDNLGMAGGFQRRRLAGFIPEVDDTGLELLLEIKGVQFQFFDV